MIPVLKTRLLKKEPIASEYYFVESCEDYVAVQNNANTFYIRSLHETTEKLYRCPEPIDSCGFLNSNTILVTSGSKLTSFLVDGTEEGEMELPTKFWFTNQCLWGHERVLLLSFGDTQSIYTLDLGTGNFNHVISLDRNLHALGLAVKDDLIFVPSLSKLDETGILNVLTPENKIVSSWSLPYRPMEITLFKDTIFILHDDLKLSGHTLDGKRIYYESHPEMLKISSNEEFLFVSKPFSIDCYKF